MLGLVGKAITFDTGGISLKPAAAHGGHEGRHGRRRRRARARWARSPSSGCRCATIAVVAAAENMLGGDAYRPGDILTAANGKTIEVTNTDAEGRLVLADALWYARSEGATHVIDLATLTGAMVLALGDLYAGFFANDDAWRDQIVAAGEASGDHAWPLPAPPRYRRYVDSTFADMKNASILREGSPVARRRVPAASSRARGRGPTSTSPARPSSSRSRGDYLSAAGGTGYGVRLIVELAGRLADMNFDLSPEHELVRDTVREFARRAGRAGRRGARPREPLPVRARRGAGRARADGDADPRGVRRRRRRHALVRDRDRGADADRLVGRDHGRRAHSLGTMPIFLFGSEEQKREWLPDLASGRKLAAFGLTEPDAGSDAGATRTTAELRDGQWVVNGSKMFITNAGTDITACVTITARTGEARSRTSSSRTARPATRSPRRCTSSAGAPPTRASCRSRTAPCPRATCSARAARASSSSSRSSTAAASPSRRWASASRRAPTTSRYAYAQERQQFGKPIAKFQAVQFQLADMATEIEAGRALVYKAAWLKDEGRAVRAGGGDGEALHRRALATGRRTRRCRSTAATGSWTSTRSRGSTATRRSSRSARARTRCSAW